jgi:hypothetical protein
MLALFLLKNIYIIEEVLELWTKKPIQTCWNLVELKFELAKQYEQIV